MEYNYLQWVNSVFGFKIKLSDLISTISDHEKVISKTQHKASSKYHDGKDASIFEQNTTAPKWLELCTDLPEVECRDNSSAKINILYPQAKLSGQ